MAASTTSSAETVTRSLTAMAAGTRGEFDVLYHPEFTNRMAVAEPPATRGRGPAAAWATALWLRTAYADLRWSIERLVVDGDLVITYGTMSGRQTGPFTTYTADARVERVFPATGRTFETAQAHFLTMRDGLIVEHWAVRDDLGHATQLGWIPPSPAFLLRSALATRRARREQEIGRSAPPPPRHPPAGGRRPRSTRWTRLWTRRALSSVGRAADF